jgi:hypothetical protein
VSRRSGFVEASRCRVGARTLASSDRLKLQRELDAIGRTPLPVLEQVEQVQSESEGR